MAAVVLNLVVLRSADMERAARFYRLLGIHFERERHGAGPEHLTAQVGPAVLELYPQDDAPDPVGVRLGFRVVSVDAVVEAMRLAGESVVAPTRRGPWGYRTVLADPDGRRVEVSEDEAADGPG